MFAKCPMLQLQMTRKEITLFIATILFFIALVNFFAYVQLTFVLKHPLRFEYFIVPLVLSIVFGTLFFLSRYYYQKAQEKEMYERIAKIDILTSAMSRYACELVLDMEFKRLRRFGTSFSLILLDIDDFKRVNDCYGHPVGDRVLQALHTCLVENLREIDTVSRWGGEEFLVVLPDTSRDYAMSVAEKLRVGVQSYDFSLEFPITISLGVVTIDKNDEKLEDILVQVDDALYEAKRKGKNQLIAVEKA